MGPCADRRCDFFVSYTEADKPWAVWIAWIVEEMGFRAMVQAWDFPPGSNWVQLMDEALKRCARMIAVLSPDYEQSVYGGAEWQAVWAADAAGTRRKLLPVRVKDFNPEGLLATVVRTDLFGTDESTARGRLEAMLNGPPTARAKPAGAPPFPGGKQSRQRAQFPGAATPGQSAAIDGGAASDNVTNLDDFRRRSGDSAGPPDPELFLRLSTDFLESAELVGTGYAAGSPEYTWTRLDVERKLAHANAYLETISEHLLRAGLEDALATFTLRYLIRQSARRATAFSGALNALEVRQRPAQRYRLLDEYEAAKRTLEELLWSIHDELVTVLPSSGSR